MVASCSLGALAALLAAAAPPTAVERSILVATAVEPLRVDKLADALRTYLDAARVEVRTAPAVSSPDLRADLAASVAAWADEKVTAVLRIAMTSDDAVEIVLSDLPSERTVITTIPRSERDQDLYRTLALKVQGLLRPLGEPPPPTSPPPSAVAPAVAPAPSVVDVQAGFTVLTFPLGDVTQEGAVLRGRWIVAPTIRLGLGFRVLPSVQRRSGPVDVAMRAMPLVFGLERFWRWSRYEVAGGLLVLAEARYAKATAGSSTRDDWTFVPGGGLSLGFSLRLGQGVRLSVQAAAIGLPWSDRYSVDGVTVFDASRLEIPVDLTLDVAF